MGGEPAEIPAAGVRPSHNDDGYTLTRSERQVGYWPKKAVFIEGIDRPHEGRIARHTRAGSPCN